MIIILIVIINLISDSSGGKILSTDFWSNCFVQLRIDTWMI